MFLKEEMDKKICKEKRLLSQIRIAKHEKEGKEIMKKDATWSKDVHLLAWLVWEISPFIA